MDCVLPGQADCDQCDDLLALASAVERRGNTHWRARWFTRRQPRGVRDLYPAANGVATLTGRGVTGEVNGQRVAIGSHSYFDQSVPHPLEHCDALAAVDAQGYSTMLVSRNDSYRGYIATADTVRPDSRAAIAELKQMGLHHLVMLTGDNAATARIVADEVGVSETLANCLPEDKVDAVRALQARYGEIAMVGDGINDAPALATSTVGIAMRQHRPGHGNRRCDADARRARAAALCRAPQPGDHAHGQSQRRVQPAGSSSSCLCWCWSARGACGWRWWRTWGCRCW